MDKDEFVVALNNNGTIEFDSDDGTIRYYDSDGNCEGKWEPGEAEYDRYKTDHFPYAVVLNKDENA